MEKKFLVIYATQLTGGLLLKKVKYFEVILNIFEFSRVWENLEPWLVYANKQFESFSTNVPTVGEDLLRAFYRIFYLQLFDSIDQWKSTV